MHKALHDDLPFLLFEIKIPQVIVTLILKLMSVYLQPGTSVLRFVNG